MPLPNTKRGYEFGEVSSAMQKAVRHADAKLAGYWALELWESGFGQYVWRRLLTVSAEDCWGILTQEVKALHDSYTEVNRHTPSNRAFLVSSTISSIPDPMGYHIMQPRFPLGEVFATSGAMELGEDLTPYIRRHHCGDWGVLDDEDKQTNEDARALLRACATHHTFLPAMCERDSGEPMDNEWLRDRPIPDEDVHSHFRGSL